LASQEHPIQVHWFCRMPTPYNDELFRALAELGAITLMVHYKEPVQSSWPWKSELGRGYPHRFYRKVLGVDWTLVSRAFGSSPRFFVIGGWHEPTIVLLLIALVLWRRPFAIWTDAPELDRRRPFWKEWLRATWLRWVLRHAFRVMGTGQLALRNLRAMGCSESRLVDLPYVIDALAFPHAIRSAPQSGAPIVFVSTGRLVTYKGYGLAIRALAAARQRGVSFRYALAGTGPEEAELRRLAEEIGVAEHVEFAGWLEPLEIQQFLLRGHYMLHPALFEPFGVTVIEAMASGLPVIGSDGTGAVVDRVIDGQNGFVHRAGDIASLTEQILRAASSVEHLEEMSAAALASAQEWSPSRAAGLVKSLVEASTRGGHQQDR